MLCMQHHVQQATARMLHCSSKDEFIGTSLFIALIVRLYVCNLYALSVKVCALHAADHNAWRVVAEEQFVEAFKSPALWRALYIPVFSAQRVHWTRQLLLSSSTLISHSNKEANQQQ